MLSMPVGAVILAMVFVFLMTGMDAGLLLNSHSLVLVGLGTFGVLCFSTHTGALKGLLRALIMLRETEPKKSRITQALLDLGKNRTAPTSWRHPLIVHAQSLWDQGLDPETASCLMFERLEELNSQTELAVSTLRNLAKYPPALGMTGTVLGMISLFSSLTPESRDKIGPNLALAMTATFYGLLLANLVVMPLADRLVALHSSRVRLNKRVHQIVMLIHEGHPQSVIKEELYGSAA